MSEANAENTDQPNLTPEAREKIAGVKTQVHSSFGQVVLAMSSVPRYRHQSLADLAHLVIDPLVRDCIAIASPQPAEEADPKAVFAPSAIAIWASVSAEVEAKIREQIKGGAFPVRLKPGEWKSGDKVWLLDVIAPTRELATAVLTGFDQIAKTPSLNIHPVVARLVDPEVVKKLAQRASDEGETSSQTVN